MKRRILATLIGVATVLAYVVVLAPQGGIIWGD
jgi:hypothetical protein